MVSTRNRTRVLVFVDWYEPGFRGGGMIRSVVAFVNRMKFDLDIHVLTRDRDLADKVPYPGIQTDFWLDIDGVNVCYISPRRLTYSQIKKSIDEVHPDWIYLNSMFSLNFSIIPLLLTHFYFKSIKVLLAPRGMLKKTALQYKHLKKIAFLCCFKLLGLHKGVVFQATSEEEKKDITDQFKNAAEVIHIPNPTLAQKKFLPIGHKIPGSLKMIFVGRIHPLKNLDFALKVIKPVDGQIELTIIGHIDDDDYWQRCQGAIDALNGRAKINFIQGMHNARLYNQLADHHLFISPTQGENFGHAIQEALSAGRPVLISDQTPWRALEVEKAGWDIPLNEPERFSAVIEKVMNMGTEELNTWTNGAWNYGMKLDQSSSVAKRYLDLFCSKA